MAGRLDGRVAVITGAGQGIGRGIARRFAREGCRIVVAERDATTGPRTVAELEALGAEASFVATDVTRDPSCPRTCPRAEARALRSREAPALTGLVRQVRLMRAEGLVCLATIASVG